MHRGSLALVLALLLAGLTFVDPWLCSDGCADEPIGGLAASPEAKSDCVLCRGASDVTRTASCAPARLFVRCERETALCPEAVAPRPIDHPPRPA